ncbi:hypothetical protein BU24DRAFT_193827 [Aaosphaeria arxii CBS 175.79]|uniref:Putative transcription factor kapC n=1 Tax=Aaosphaeria arxii CBS 175.79 TaxID=1450172 RepID=A0A6A5XSF1_9PLEO|nr:uncharacterized protein BU24DRAFT_193827 [Aaosphaeria arxii CBS 175.79]KAF2016102.1 hypothetical protein BU24DRAFT_193827 [Aaosphaeria arxii CBS 175.79]
MPNGLPTLYPSIRTFDVNMQQPAQDHKPNIEMSLREHLLAAGAGQPTASQPLQQHPHPGSPQHAIDPAIAGSAYQMSQGEAGDGHLSEGRKGRRELSTSKRAAQNRAAQRAFRQRKEEYIKQLKDQVKEFEQLCELYKALQNENYQLRDYIINLQSRLLESQGEIPPAPAGVDLSRQHPEPPSTIVQAPQPPQQPEQQQSSPTNNGGLSERQIGELQMAAQAAAAAQHGPPVNNGKHPNSDGPSFDTGDYADKRPKVDDSTQQDSGNDFAHLASQLQQSAKETAA